MNENKKIPATSLNLHSLIQTEILFYQIYQNEFAKIQIKILPKPKTKLTDNEILDIFKKDMKDKLKGFSVKYIITKSEKEIIKSSRGKMIILVQELFKNSN